jgi:hypothetical protein
MLTVKDGPGFYRGFLLGEALSSQKMSRLAQQF